jgi:hypothetical protein
VSSDVCPRCGAPRASGPECPQCGVFYAKAERLAEEREAAAAEAEMFPVPAPRPSAAAVFAQTHSLDQAKTELWLARLAVPGALLVCLLLKFTDLGAFVLRTFFGMWLHELGHATTAWMCAFPAIPGPWFTSISDERSYLFALALAAGCGALIYRGREEENRTLIAAGAAGLAALVVGTFGLKARTAQMFITFGGDAGSLVFGAALMACFFVPPDHKLHRDWLRWGFLVIGAASFVDTFHEWWIARTDPSIIAYGEIEGMCDTDPTKLTGQYGWSERALIRRYVSLGVVSLLALVPLQVLHMRRSKAALEELEG